ARQRRLATEQPPPRLAVIAQRRLVERLALGIGIAARGVEIAQRVIGKAALLQRVEVLVRPIVRPGGEVVHAKGAGRQQPLAVLDERLGSASRWLLRQR